MKYELIELQKFPSMAAPWSSQDEGETWIWDCYFGTIQKHPPSIASLIRKKIGEQEPQSGCIIYYYAMTIFYNKDKNPHGRSSRPILSVGIEQFQMKEGAKNIHMPLKLGIFRSASRSNLGNYNGTLSIDDVRQNFFDVWKSELRLRGEPQKIGRIMDAYGHPRTGWESQEVGESNIIDPIDNSKIIELFSKVGRNLVKCIVFIISLITAFVVALIFIWLPIAYVFDLNPYRLGYWPSLILLSFTWYCARWFTNRWSQLKYKKLSRDKMEGFLKKNWGERIVPKGKFTTTNSKRNTVYDASNNKYQSVQDALKKYRK